FSRSPRIRFVFGREVVIYCYTSLQQSMKEKYMWSDPKLFAEIRALTYVPGNTLVRMVRPRTRLVFMPQTVASKYSLKMGGDQWIVLTDLGANRWQVQLWGPETMQVNCIGLTT